MVAIFSTANLLPDTWKHFCSLLLVASASGFHSHLLLQICAKTFMSCFGKEEARPALCLHWGASPRLSSEWPKLLLVVCNPFVGRIESGLLHKKRLL
eukprot:979037-Pelagomonas_calceolata.AAC.1